MNENELEQFQAELRAAKPAFVPEDFMARLQAAKPLAAETAVTTPARSADRFGPRLWRWLAPALALTAAAAVVVLLVVHSHPSPATSQPPLALASDTRPRTDALPKPGLQADYVQMDEELVSSFDVVATLPGGEPVRFRCRQWRDQLLVTDKTNGVEIEQNRPRVEVVPVRFETY